MENDGNFFTECWRMVSLGHLGSEVVGRLDSTLIKGSWLFPRVPQQPFLLVNWVTILDFIEE